MTTTVLTAPTAAPPDTAPEPRPRPARHDTVMAALVAAGATTLSTLAVGSLLSGTRWLAHALGGIVLVLVLGVVGRSARLPRPTVVVGQLVACVGWVTAFYAGPMAVLGVFPGPAATGRLRDRVDAGFATLDRVTLPFTPDHDVALIAVAGVLATAIAVDALFAGYRRPVLAGVPLLALYAVPAFTLPEGPRTWLFVLPALGLLLLLVGDDRQRLVRWGLLPHGADLAHAGARRTGALIGVIVLAIAVIVPVLLPNVSAGLFAKQGIGQEKTDPITTVDPLVDMRRNLVRPADVDLLDVTSDTAHPDEQYLRAVTLDEFNGRQWRAGDRRISTFDTVLPLAPGLSPAIATTPVESTMHGLTAFKTDYLPLPYPATTLRIDGKWRVDPVTGNVLSTDGRDQAAGRTYSVGSLDLDPTRADVGDSYPGDGSLERYLALPHLPDRVGDTARRVAKGAQGPLEIGLRLQSWLRNPRNFTYDLRTPQGSGTSAVVDFLNRRRGYCEQFASTMAVMARSLGVPARVNVGFTAGEAQGGGRVISAHDAHAWPELYLPQVGWTRFEPTPGTASSGPTVPQWLQDSGGSQKDDGKGADAAPPSPADAGDSPADQAEPPPPPAGDAGGDAVDCSADVAGCEASQAVAPPDNSPSSLAFLTWAFLFLFLLFLLAALPWLVRAGLRRRRWASVIGARAGAGAGTPEAAAAIAEVAWVELRDTALDLGYAWPAARTPRQTAATLTRDAWLHEAAEACLADITALVERARYSAAGGHAPDPAEIRTTVEDVCTALGESAGRNARVRARVAPRSLLTSLARSRRDRGRRRGRDRERRARGGFRRVARGQQS